MERNQKKEQQLNAMLTAVGKKLGMNPEQLRQMLSTGSAEQLSEKMKTHAGGNPSVSAILRDKKKLEQVMNSPQAKALYEKLMGKGQ